MNRRVVLFLTALLTLSACGPQEPESLGGPPLMRRLTEDQYRRIVADVFGPDIVIGGRFAPLTRTDGLLALGASASIINSSSYELYDNLARAIAAQVVDSAHRDWLVPCKPGVEDGPDTACAAQFFKQTGRLLYRRHLTDDELKLQVELAALGAKELKSFYNGLAASLSAMLVAPEFLFINDTTEKDEKASGGVRLTAYAKASRLSFFLWNTSPDHSLLTAAEKGELNDSAGIAKQVARLMASPRIEDGTRAFFNDMLAFETFDTLQKDAVIYPAFGLATVKDAREQILRTIVDHLLVQKADYRGLFTTRKTFMSAPLGMVYRAPADDPDGWAAYEFPDGDQHVGIQSFVGFVSLHSHPGRSSATLRGKAVRETLMCQKVPDPPANVDFTLVSDSANPIYKTARERLAAHSTEPSCAGCHKLMDPIGLTLENFDGAGQWRKTENGIAINTGGALDGVAYDDAVGLGKALAANPSVPSCLVNRLVNYATGRTADRKWLAYLEQKFSDDKYRLPDLLQRIARSDVFYAVTPAQTSTQAAGSAGAREGKS